MKRLLAILLTVVLSIACVLTIVGCKKPNDNNSSSSSSSSSSVVETPEVVKRDVNAIIQENSQAITVADVINAKDDYSILKRKTLHGVMLGDILKESFGKQFMFDYYSDGNWYLSNGTKFSALANAIYNHEVLSGKALELSDAQLKAFGKQKFVNAVLSPFSITVDTMLGQMPQDMLAAFKPLLDMTVENFNDMCKGNYEYLKTEYSKMPVDTMLDGVALISSFAATSGSETDAQLYITFLKHLLTGTLSSVTIDGETSVSALIEDFAAIVKANATFIGEDGTTDEAAKSAYYAKIDDFVEFLEGKVGGTVGAPEFGENVKASDFVIEVINKAKELFGKEPAEGETETVAWDKIEEYIRAFFGDTLAKDMLSYVVNDAGLSEIFDFAGEMVSSFYPQSYNLVISAKSMLNSLFGGTLAQPELNTDGSIGSVLDFAGDLVDFIAEQFIGNDGLKEEKAIIKALKTLYSSSTITSIISDIKATSEEAFLAAVETLLTDLHTDENTVAAVKKFIGDVLGGNLGTLDPVFAEKTLEEVDNEYFGGNFFGLDEDLILAPIKGFKVKDVKSLFDGGTKNEKLMEELSKISFVDFTEALNKIFGGKKDVVLSDLHAYLDEYIQEKGEFVNPGNADYCFFKYVNEEGESSYYVFKDEMLLPVIFESESDFQSYIPDPAAYSHVFGDTRFYWLGEDWYSSASSL